VLIAVELQETARASVLVSKRDRNVERRLTVAMLVVVVVVLMLMMPNLLESVPARPS
jgi:hypothetical protein